VLQDFHKRGVVLEHLHRDLLPLDETDFGAEGFGALIRPYESELAAGQRIWLEVEVRNPAPIPEEVFVTLNDPDGGRSARPAPPSASTRASTGP
jgi:hypothetical protein